LRTVSAPKHIIIFVLNTDFATRRCLSNSSWELNKNTGNDEGDYTECGFGPNIQVSKFIPLKENHTTFKFNELEVKLVPLLHYL